MIAIIDYGIGNVRSVMNAMKFIGADPIITSDPQDIMRADGLILPGVGSYKEGMRRLVQYNLCNSLIKYVESKRPLLGICLGFQLLMKSSAEHEKCFGLSFIDYQVVRLPVQARLPHVGWSSVCLSNDSLRQSILLDGLNDEAFYFVHSYGVLRDRTNMPPVAGVTKYADCELISLIEDCNIFGTQFHPEKSGESGLLMLNNFKQICV